MLKEEELWVEFEIIRIALGIKRKFCNINYLESAAEFYFFLFY